MYPRQNSLAPNLIQGKELILHQLQTAAEERRGEPLHKNRWVSTERNDGTATGAGCDWSISSSSKPFFSLRHVQSVDKRHHPTDSLINCEMYSYLPLSYSPCPQNPSASPLLPVYKERKTNWTPQGFLLKKKKCSGCKFSVSRFFSPSPS